MEKTNKQTMEKTNKQTMEKTNKQTMEKTKNELWSYSKLSKIPAYNRNRKIEHRVSKLTKILKKGFVQTQAEIAIGVAVNPFGGYKKNEKFILNGNTRMLIYKNNPELIPPIPFDVKVYECFDYEQTYNLYTSFDSSDSVETSSDKITGYLREKGYEPVSKVISTGKFKTALNIAAMYGTNNEGVYLQTMDFSDKLSYFWDELVYLDQSNLNLFDKRYSGNLLGSLLLITKKYGLKNKRLNLLIKNLQDGITTINNGHNIDGVHYVYNDLYLDNLKQWKSTSYSNYQTACSQILYCLDKFMKDETLNKDDLKKLKGNKLFEFYQYYNERK
jgi:hypothetical protein